MPVECAELPVKVVLIEKQYQHSGMIFRNSPARLLAESASMRNGEREATREPGGRAGLGAYMVGGCNNAENSRPPFSPPRLCCPSLPGSTERKRCEGEQTKRERARTAGRCQRTLAAAGKPLSNSGSVAILPALPSPDDGAVMAGWRARGGISPHKHGNPDAEKACAGRSAVGTHFAPTGLG